MNRRFLPLTLSSSHILSVPFLLTAITVAGTANAQTATTPLSSVAFSNEVEASLVRALETLKDGGIKPALKEIDSALEKNPNFRLGHMIKGDLLMAKAGSPVAFGPTAQPDVVASLRDEARVRLNRYFDAPPNDSLPTALLQLAPHYQHVLLLDSEKSRIYVFKNEDGHPKQVADFYISGGKMGFEKAREGDQRTPLGVYHITSSMGREKLPDFYGAGAFPINYPNEWDKRLGKNGSGIWIHGTPSNTYSRPPRASDGCVVLTNDDFAKISRFVEPGVTPVVITASVQWQPREQWQEFRGDFANALDRWKSDWESLRMDAYLTHYSSAFNTDGKGLADWSASKRRINAGKSYVKVDISNLSVFEYPISPGTPPMLMVTFDQEYKSSNNSAKMKKRQYWQREDGRWKILYEAAAS
ncbi:MAG: L,D-transpeptidase family protein [Betaproteobacteria bacterium]|nr:L,D-transpeptidase family protein [Betaproteobacteria bacterium]